MFFKVRIIRNVVVIPEFLTKVPGMTRNSVSKLDIKYPTRNIDMRWELIKTPRFFFRPNSGRQDYGSRSRPVSGIDHDCLLHRRKDALSDSTNVNLTVDGIHG